MLYLDKETGSFKTKSQLLKELKREADAFSGDGYKVSARELFSAMLEDGLLQPLQEFYRERKKKNPTALKEA